MSDKANLIFEEGDVAIVITAAGTFNMYSAATPACLVGDNQDQIERNMGIVNGIWTMMKTQQGREALFQLGMSTQAIEELAQDQDTTSSIQ